MKTFALFALIVLSHCNIWDNLYSQTLADTPIILSESLNFQFKLRNNLQAKIDFNADLQTVTLFIYANVLIRVDLLRAQLDLSTLVLTVNRVNSKECERYNIAAFKGVSMQERKISKQRLYLINIFFKFIGKTQSTPLKKTVYNIYKLEPFLLSAPSKLKQLEQEVRENLPEDINFDEDYKPNLQLYLHINSATGNLQAIYSGQNMQTRVPFSTASTLRAKYNCDAQIHSMSSNDLNNIFEFIQKNAKKV